MTTIRQGHWLLLNTDLEVWLHDHTIKATTGSWLLVVRCHGDGRVTVRNSGKYFTLNAAMLERIKLPGN